jgi:hypothetical protein
VSTQRLESPPWRRQGRALIEERGFNPVGLDPDGHFHQVTSPEPYRIAFVAAFSTPPRLHERALAICEARLGADHPGTVRSRQRLAAVVAALDERR